MDALLIGSLGFLIAYLFDWASLRRISGCKQIIGSVVIGLQVYALFLACWGINRFWLPSAASWLGWLLLPISMLLFIYSIFVEIPFAKTYLRTGGSGQLVTTGTYALVRHPGVLWYILILLSLLLVTRSKTLLIAAPVWAIMDIIWAVIQERFFFERMFPSYGEYKRRVPMLIPTKKSIVDCLRTFKTREVTE